MSHQLLSRRHLLVAGAATAVAGCVPFEKTSPFWGTIGAGLRGEATKQPVGRDYANSLPYASMLAWFEGAPKALLVLAEAEPGPRWIWRSAERQSLITQGPYISALIGLDLELRGTQFREEWDPNPIRMAGRRATRILDVVGETHRTQVALQSRFQLAGLEDIQIEGVPYRLQKVTEAIFYDGRRRAENEYWVDLGDGRCWKSRQLAVPTLPDFNIELMKYPST